jgi:hypothetical protein
MKKFKAELVTPAFIPTQEQLATLTYDQLVSLGKRAYSMARTIQDMKQRDAVREFRIGDVVEFKNGKGIFSPAVRITVEKINPKSLSGKTAEGRGWRVAPTLCTKVAAPN